MKDQVELLKVVQYCRENGFTSSANWIEATIPFKSIEFTFKLSKQLHPNTGELLYHMDLCYPVTKGGASHSRISTSMEAKYFKSEEEAFDALAFSASKMLFLEKVGDSKHHCSF